MTAKPVRRQTPPNRLADAAWPSLPFIEWRETCETLHMWTQIVGKTRLAQSPMINHWWRAPLYVTSRGLTTSPNTPDFVVREAYSHEVSSAGFWPGAADAPEPVFYSYAYPEPEGFAGWRPEPDEAYYSAEMKEFILPYEVVRRAKEPDRTLMRFLQSAYEAAAHLGKWDRPALERRVDQSTQRFRQL